MPLPPLAIAALFVTSLFGVCAFDVTLTNPPYVGMTPNTAISKLYKTANCGDLYGWLFENCLRFLGKDGALGLIVPLSVTFDKPFHLPDIQFLNSRLSVKGYE